MSLPATQIFDEATKLPPLERIDLIEKLFFSLDSSEERDRIDKLWAVEVEDRIDAYERGEMRAIPAEEVFRRLELRRR